MKRILPAMLMLLLSATPAMAEQIRGAQVSLSAMAEAMLPNDEVVLRYRIEADGQKADGLRQQVNRISQTISERLKHEKGLVHTTTGRRMEPVWHYDRASRRRIRDGWRMVQDGQVTSTRLEAVPGWLEAIEQAGAHLQGLSFRVSRDSENAARDRLRMQAIAKFRARAALTAKALGATSFRILRLNTNAMMPRPVQPMLAMAKAERVQPALSAGESRLSVTVTGSILLPEKDYPVK